MDRDETSYLFTGRIIVSDSYSYSLDFHELFTDTDLMLQMELEQCWSLDFTDGIKLKGKAMHGQENLEETNC